MPRPHSIKFNTKLGLTKQSFKDECDINKIMAKFQRTGVCQHYAKHAPTYGDATPIQLMDAQQIIVNAQTMFDELPSSIRKKFNNEPGEFLAFVQDETNLEEMRKLGLANPSPLSDNGPSGEAQRQPAPASSDPKGTTENKGEGQENNS